MPEDRPLVIRVHITPDDYARYVTCVSGDPYARRQGRILAAIHAGLAIVIAGVLGPSWMGSQFGFAYEIGFVISTAVVMLAVAFTVWILHGIVQSCRPDTESIFWHPHTYYVSLDGVRIEGERCKYQFLWSAFRAARETVSHFFLFIDSRVAYLVPKRSFQSQAEEATFRELLRSKLELETR